jgi:hypothetical protein
MHRLRRLRLGLRAPHGEARPHACPCGLLVRPARSATPPMTVPRRECRRVSRPRSTKTAGGIELPRPSPSLSNCRAAESWSLWKMPPLHSEAAHGPARPVPLARGSRAFNAGFGRSKHPEPKNSPGAGSAGAEFDDRSKCRENLAPRPQLAKMP